MSAFWIVGIGINVAALAALAWWAVRNWRQRDEQDVKDDLGNRPGRH